jgi:hypothetical protein
MRVKIFEEKPNMEIENEINKWLKMNKNIKIHNVTQSSGFEWSKESGRSYTVISIFYESRVGANI